MRSLAIINQKGGVGKTTTAVHLAAGMARQGHRTLLVDLDPQSHASLHVGIQLEPGDPSVYGVLVHGDAIPDVAHTVAENLTLLPANIDLVGAELELRESERREQRLAEAFAAVRDQFDVCVIDCPPSLGLLTVNALTAVNDLVIPLQAHFLALQGLGRLLETVTLVREGINPELRVTAITFSMFEKGTRLAQEILDDVTQFVAAAEPGSAWRDALVCTTYVRRNIKLAECPSFGQTVFDYAPDSHGAEDYAALTREIAAQLFPAQSATAPQPASASKSDVPPMPADATPESSGKRRKPKSKADAVEQPSSAASAK